MSSRNSRSFVHGRTNRSFYDHTFEKVREHLEPREAEPEIRRWGTRRVYFLHVPALGIVKIGTSAQVETRTKNVWPRKMPCEAVVIGEVNGGRDIERVIHDKFAKHRMHGEWFADVILDEVKEMIEADRWHYGKAA